MAMTLMGGRGCAHCNKLAQGGCLGNDMVKQSFCFGFKEEAAFHVGLKDDWDLLQEKEIVKRAGRAVRAYVGEQGGAGLGRNREEADCRTESSARERIMETSLQEYIGTRS